MWFVVPYRATVQTERKAQLAVFLEQVHARVPDSRVLVAEQDDDAKFNRGGLFNAAVAYALQSGLMAPDECVCFHDVDMVPAESLLPEYTRPLGAGTARHVGCIPRYQALGSAYLGGILLMRVCDYAAVNGHSNRFQGWGREDTDFRRRLARGGVRVERIRGEVTDLEHMTLSDKIAHNRATRNAGRKIRWPDAAADGLTSTQYTVTTVQKEAPHVWRVGFILT